MGRRVVNRQQGRRAPRTGWRRLLRYMELAVMWPTSILVRLGPRDPDLWVTSKLYGSRFGDNARYFYEWVQRQRPEGMRLVWLTDDPELTATLRERGWDVAPYTGRRSWAVRLRAGVLVHDSYPHEVGYWLTRGAFEVNLWHGIPLKEVGRQFRRRDAPLLRISHPWIVTRPNAMVATCQECQDRLARCFPIPAERIWITGYPRVDALLEEPEPATQAVRDWMARIQEWRSAGRRVVLWLPTYREDDEVATTLDQVHTGALPRDVVVLVKAHPWDRREWGDDAAVHEVDRAVDPYVLLPHVDALLTDVSSLAYDALVLDIPIGYIAPDLDAYQKEERGLLADFNAERFGPTIAPGEDVAAFTARLLAAGVDATERQRARDHFHPLADGRSSQRILERVRQAQNRA